ncbi:MAG: tetratricopeptide repeat protein [Rhodospirillales bacterium]
MAEPSDPLLREIQEELREERFAKLWKRYGRAVLAAAAVLVAGVAAAQWYQDRALKSRLADSARYDAAGEMLREGGGEAARTAFESLAADAGDGYALLARLRAAQLAAAEGDIAGARAAFLSVADDDSEDALYRRLAAYRAAVMGMALKTSPETLRTELAPLTVEDSPWRLLARELLAMIDLETGAMTEARTAFQAIIDDAAATPAMRVRAETALSVLVKGGA